MDFFADNILIVFVLPLLAGVISLLAYIFKYVFSNKTVNILTTISNLTGLVFSIFIFRYLVLNNVQDIGTSVNWFKIENLNFVLGVYADKISLVFLFVLMASCLAIHYFSLKYLIKDPKYCLYTSYLNLTNAAMVGLLLSSNIPQTYIFGEIVCVLGYLFINTNFKNSKISNQARNFFILNIIGDTLMLTGIIILIYFLITYPIYSGNVILPYSDFNEIASDLYVYFSDMWFYVACMLLFAGIASKSAQFPFHLWAVDTAKTPVSAGALLLSSAMTASGLFIAIRLLPLFELSIQVMNTILYIGLITALFCGFLAIAQNNIKKMLSYSSSSQFGLMIASIGLNLQSAAIMYFLSHAFSKAVLFMVSGCLYRISLRQNFNISDFNSSRTSHPILAYCYFISIISISGLFFGGAAANDEMIKACSASMHISVLVIFLLACFISAYYLFRSYFVIFENNQNADNNSFNQLLIVPVIFLTLLIVCVPFFPTNIFDFFNKYEEISRELINGTLKYLLLYGFILLGAVLGAYIGFTKKKPLPKYLINLSLHGFYIKKIFTLLSDIILDIFRSFTKNFDKYVLNWFFNLFTELTRWISWIVSILQNGNIQTYITIAIIILTLSISGIGMILVILRGII